jgi:integrase
MGLTDTAIRKLKPEEKPYRISDGKGLFLEVSPQGGKLWRWAYRFEGKQKKLGLGRYPEVSLAAARELHSETRRLLASGADPMLERKIQKVRAIQNPQRPAVVSKHLATPICTPSPARQSRDADDLAQEVTSDSPFRVLAVHWFDHWKNGKAPKHVSRTRNRLDRNLFPPLAALPISRIEPKDIIRMVKFVEERGVLEVARRSLEITKQIFEFGIAHDYVKLSPAASIRPKLVLKPYVAKNMARVEENDLPGLLRAIGGFGGRKLVLYALRLMTLTFLRTGELLGAEWKEFDLKKRQWKVPAMRMKMDSDHIVPLSRQAIAILKNIKALTGDSQYVFPGEYQNTKTMNTNALLEALYAMGYKGKQTGHGFRGLASTMLHELGYPHEHIELQLAHTKRDKVAAAYNYALYLEPRAQMMQDWADRIDGLMQQNDAE